MRLRVCPHDGGAAGAAGAPAAGAAGAAAGGGVDADAIAAAQIIYLEGYLWDPPRAKEAFLKAAKIAHDAERDVALTLSDAFCVDRYRAEFLDLIRNGTVDLVFANERELHSLYETADFDTALEALRKSRIYLDYLRNDRGSTAMTWYFFENWSICFCQIQAGIVQPGMKTIARPPPASR